MRYQDVAAFNERPHKPEEERQQKGAYVRPVHIRVCHDNDLAVAEFRDVEILAYPGAQSCDHRSNLHIGEDPVDARLLHIEDLAPDRHDRLESAVAAGFRGSAGRVALHDVELAQGRIAQRTVGKLPGKRRYLQRRLSASEFLGLSRRFASPRRRNALLDDLAGRARVLLKVYGQAFR